MIGPKYYMPNWRSSKRERGGGRVEGKVRGIVPKAGEKIKWASAHRGKGGHLPPHGSGKCGKIDEIWGYFGGFAPLEIENWAQNNV